MSEYLSNKSIATSLDGLRISVITPDGASSTGFKTESLAPTLLLSDVISDVADNEDAITVLEDDVAVVQANSVKQTFTDKTSTFNFTQYKDEHIELMIFRQKSGTSTVSIGISPSVDDILTSRVIDSTEYRNTNTVVAPGTNDRTILVNVTGGSVDLVVFSKRLVFGL